MENYIENIELINNYINRLLSENETKNFENRLKTDDAFRFLYEEHMVLLEGIKRQELKTEIQKGKKLFVRRKWLRFLGGAFGAIVLLFMVYLSMVNPDKAYLKDKLNFEAEYIQYHKVSIDSIVEIVGEKGTIIQFNPNDLETTSKNPFTGDSLNVELIELVNKQDLLLANAQTISNEEWLISGGAFKIDISTNNENLVLKDGKTISVAFPKNSEEPNMELFYGERDNNGYMNWMPMGKGLKSGPYVILIEQSYLVDEEVTKRYEVDSFREVYVCDTLGFTKDLSNRYPKGNFFDKNVDTIRIMRERVRIIDDKYDCELSWLDLKKTFKTNALYSLVNKKEVVIDSILIDLEIDMASECRELWGEVIRQISKNENDTLRNIISRKEYEEHWENYPWRNEQAQFLNTVTDGFYKSAEISKLGWINIDKFALKEETVKVKLDFNINTNHNEIYLIDESNNTVLNIFDDEINLPKNRSFKITAIGVKGKEIYGFKKSVRFKTSSVLEIDFKNLQATQVRSFLKIK